MNKVFFIINHQEVYVCDYFNEAFKMLPFKEKDYWELYDRFDLRELIEFMNYPLNYNQFKDSKVQIVYSHPTVYAQLFEEKEGFLKSLGLETANLLTMLQGYCIQEGFTEGAIQYERVYYVFDEKTGQKVLRLATREETDVFEEAHDTIPSVKTLDLCKYLVTVEDQFIPFQANWLVLSPVTLERAVVHVDKPAYLETHYTMDSPQILTTQSVKEGDILFTYTQHVAKMWGRTKTQTLAKKAATSGQFYPLQPIEAGNLWAKNQALLGVVATEEISFEAVEEWLKAIGF